MQDILSSVLTKASMGTYAKRKKIENSFINKVWRAEHTEWHTDRLILDFINIDIVRLAETPSVARKNKSQCVACYIDFNFYQNFQSFYIFLKNAYHYEI